MTVGEWQSIPGGPDCECSDGSPFEIWERPADPTKVMLYFEGGGACFSAETCGPDSQTYKKRLELGVAPRSRWHLRRDEPGEPHRRLVDRVRAVLYG